MSLKQIFLSSLLTLVALVSLLSPTAQDKDCIYSKLVKSVSTDLKDPSSQQVCIPLRTLNYPASEIPSLISQIQETESFFAMLGWTIKPISLEVVQQNPSIQALLVRLQPDQFRRSHQLIHSLIKAVLLQNLDESVASHPLLLESITDMSQDLALRQRLQPFGLASPSFTLWNSETICESLWNPVEYEFSCASPASVRVHISVWSVRPYLLDQFQKVYSYISVSEKIQFIQNLFGDWKERKWLAQKQFQIATVSQFEQTISNSWKSLFNESVQVKNQIQFFQNLEGVVFSEGKIDRNKNLVHGHRYAWFEKGEWYLPSEKKWIKVSFGLKEVAFEKMLILSCQEPRIGELLKWNPQERQMTFLSVCDKNLYKTSDVIEKIHYLVARNNEKLRLFVYDRPSLEVALHWGFRPQDQIVQRLERKSLTEQQLRLTGLEDIEVEASPSSELPKEENIFSSLDHDVEKVSAALPIISYIKL
ncbi:MAG: hypothetical protein AB7F59_06150 [Bdellovibrionales bacterium]